MFEFIRAKSDELDDRFQKDWLGNPGIRVSDDGWMDLRSEVVGRGKKFFEAITVKKLRAMANSNDYHENFLYCIDEELLVKKANVKDLPLILDKVDGSAKDLLIKRLKKGA